MLEGRDIGDDEPDHHDADGGCHQDGSSSALDHRDFGGAEKMYDDGLCEESRRW